MAETWYLRGTVAATSCGPGKTLDQDAASGPLAQNVPLDFLGRAWGRIEAAARRLDPGTWAVAVRLQVTGNTGTNVALVRVFHRDSACLIKNELLSENVTLVNDTTAVYTASDTAQAVQIEVDDVVTVEVAHTQGPDAVALWFNGVSPNDSNLQNPDAGVDPGHQVYQVM